MEEVPTHGVALRLAPERELEREHVRENSVLQLSETGGVTHGVALRLAPERELEREHDVRASHSISGV